MNEANLYNNRVTLTQPGQNPILVKSPSTRNYFLDKEEEDLIQFKMLKMWGNFSSATLGRPSQEDRERKRRLREAQMKQIQMELTLDRKVTTVMKTKASNYSIFSKGKRDEADNYNGGSNARTIMENDNVDKNRNFAEKLLHRSKTFRMENPDILEDLNAMDGVRMRTKSLSREHNRNKMNGGNNPIKFQNQYDDSAMTMYNGWGVSGGSNWNKNNNNNNNSNNEFVSRLRFLDTSPIPRERELSPEFQNSQTMNRRHTVALDDDIQVKYISNSKRNLEILFCYGSLRSNI